jgi:Uma2 family endonuclease
MPLRATTYEAVALEDPEGQWELYRGRLREKPVMSIGHNRSLARLNIQLARQLDDTRYELRVNATRVRRLDEHYFIPDLVVFPRQLTTDTFGDADVLEVYDAPMLFVVEVWSPSTGTYDVDEKLPIYQQRGDLEIWRVHPRERLVTAWRRQVGGGYMESTLKGGVVALVAVPGVLIDIGALFG